MPLSKYTIDSPDSILMASINLEDMWSYDYKGECVYKCFRLTKGPGCCHRVSSCTL